jgi:hypothetical protein
LILKSKKEKKRIKQKEASPKRAGFFLGNGDCPQTIYSPHAV